MKTLKKMSLCISCMLLALCMSFSVQAAPKMAKAAVKLKKGNAYVLRLKGNSKGEKVKWKTSAKSIVKISSKSHNRAVLKAKGKGTAVITAKIGKKKYTCTVKVGKNKGIPEKLTLTVGDQYKFSSSKAAKWDLSNAKGSLNVGKKMKKAVFTALKTGKCKVKITVGEEEKICVVKIIRKDGATKADLREEKEIEKAKKAEKEKEAKALEDRKNLMVGLGYSACMVMGGDTHVADCEYHSMDLDSKTMAYMLYQYQYFADDSRIRTEGEYHVATIDDLQDMMNELFGEEDHTNAFGLFRVLYRSKLTPETPDLYYMDATGDFGDAGSCYFEEYDKETVSNNMHTLTGRVMTYNSNANTYIHTGTYSVRYWVRKDGKFQFESVKVD